MSRRFCWMVLLSVMFGYLWPADVLAQQETIEGSFSGYLYTDYYYVVNNHNEELEGENGFWTRRVYFTYDRDLSQSVSTRLRLEMNSPGDFNSLAAPDPFVKDLYLDWAMDENHSLIAGISGTPTWSLVEGVWGYRSLEKSPLDLHKMGSSRDFGIGLEGQLDEAGNVNYHVMAGNGATANSGKKFMLSLGWWLTDNFVVEAYGDFDTLADDATRTTAQGFAGYVSDRLNLGALLAAQFEDEALYDGADDTGTREVASLFGNFSLNDRWTSVFRVDRMFSANPQGPTIDYIPFSDEASSTFMLLGADYQAFSNVHIMPNIEAIFYDENDNGQTPDTDLIPRVTLYYQF